MSRHLCVQEYARLEVCEDYARRTNSLAHAYIPASAFEYLCELASQFNQQGASLLQLDGRRSLKLDNYVGLIQTPCSFQIEILPKHTEFDQQPELTLSQPEAFIVKQRKLLWDMLSVCLDLPYRQTGQASLATFRLPLHEWIMQRFLKELEALYARGFRLDYQQVEEEQPYLRGQLDVIRRMQQPLTRAHHFPIRHDVFLPDNAENRLIKSTVNLILKLTSHEDNKRQANAFKLMMSGIPQSCAIQRDFKHWRNGRLLAHYQAIKVWCELILSQHMPLALQGEFQGMSLLFPMEKIFERFVAHHLRRQLAPSYRLSCQIATETMCSYQNTQSQPQNIFRLKPDLLISAIQGEPRYFILDTKWKCLNEQTYRFGLSDQDVRQMFAYSHYYGQHQHPVILIYPKTNQFNQPHPVLHFNQTSQGTLWVLPYDLEQRTLVWGQYEALF